MISAIAAPPAHIIAQQGVQPTEAKDPAKKVSLEIAPNENNVSSGDKSQNSAQVQLTTPSDEFATELTRQEAVSSIQFRLTQNALDQSGVVNGTDSNPVRNAALIEAGALENETVQNLAEGQQANNLIDTYQSSAENALYNDQGAEESSQQQFNQASEAYIKQSLLPEEQPADIGLSVSA